MHRTVLTLFLMLAVYGLSPMAQTPSTNPAQEVHADLNRLMRGVLYPAAHKHLRGLAGDRERVAGARRVRQLVVDPGATLLQRRARSDEGPGLGDVRARGS